MKSVQQLVQMYSVVSYIRINGQICLCIPLIILCNQKLIGSSSQHGNICGVQKSLKTLAFQAKTYCLDIFVCISAKSLRPIHSLSAAIPLLMQPRILSAFRAARAPFWLKLSSSSVRILKSLSLQGCRYRCNVGISVSFRECCEQQKCGQTTLESSLISLNPHEEKIAWIIICDRQLFPCQKSVHEIRLSCYR